MIDKLIRTNGEPVEILRVIDPVFDANDVLDKQATDDQGGFDRETVPAIVSSPSTDDVFRSEGRVTAGELAISVTSDTDISANRDGIADSVEARGRTFTVDDVTHDHHPFANVEKVTAYLHNGRRGAENTYGTG